jgi:drug/metabolite transporter (DMT)-like permease
MLYLAWGSTYVAFKIAFKGLPPLLSTGSRFAIAGLVILTAARRGGARWNIVKLVHLRSAAIIGFLMVGLGTGAVVVAVKHLTTGTTALVQATVPMWVALGDRVAFGTRLSRRATTGLVVGLLGIALLAGGAQAGPSNIAWIVLVLLGSVGWAAGALVSRVLPAVEDRLTSIGLPMVVGGVMVVIVSVISGDPGRIHPQHLPYASVLAWFYLLLVSALTGYTLYMWLLKESSPTLVATSSYVDPVMALFFGWLLLGEGLTARAALSATVIVIGAALIVSAPAPIDLVSRPASSGAGPLDARPSPTRSRGRFGNGTG